MVSPQCLHEAIARRPWPVDEVASRLLVNEIERLRKVSRAAGIPLQIDVFIRKSGLKSAAIGHRALAYRRVQVEKREV